ncbi:hypothetical protein [Desnuesiella massiliensis]|uniref:hypothetical protein n=1 Tax=Desnuesiella massiliensis TaxID=1650662 RepID=UPI0006E1A15F|nr:hypothetical protein [Desnuesiella massiliensis]
MVNFSQENAASTIKDECLIAFKVYDHCSQKDCLKPSDLGPARSAENEPCKIEGTTVPAGAVITLPVGIVGVNILDNNVKIEKITPIVTPRRFTNDGYWDVSVEYTFEYALQFIKADGCIAEVECCGDKKKYIDAYSTFTKKVTLFGSVTEDLVIASNLFSPATNLLSNKPYAWVEAKAIALEAVISNSRHVDVTIGLFTIIKLFRLVNLVVLSKGFCKPKPCTQISPDPCDYFDGLNFPFEIFNPPQKEDYRNLTRNDFFNDTSCDNDIE